jgi:hypothetical protein
LRFGAAAVQEAKAELVVQLISVVVAAGEHTTIGGLTLEV